MSTKAALPVSFTMTAFMMAFVDCEVLVDWSRISKEARDVENYQRDERASKYAEQCPESVLGDTLGARDPIQGITHPSRLGRASGLSNLAHAV